MTLDWTPLQSELQRWRADGLALPLWWRDDDATSVTPQLDHLSTLSQQLHLPVHLAVIPKAADEALARYIQERHSLIPLVHGWAHQNPRPGR